MLTHAAAIQPLQAAPQQPRRAPRHRSAAFVVARSEPATRAAAPAVERRTLLLGAAALAAGSVLLQGPAAADCQFQTAPSGLQWCDVEAGAGEEPVAGARIRAHYTGRLESNGVVFDSSYERGRPLVFQIGVGQVIKGWDMGILGAEGIPAMKPGGKRTLIIPSELAYGQRGAGGVIPPAAVLRFDVEYLGKQGAR